MIDVERYRHLTRQLELIPVDTLNKPVHIIGCGAIGSFLGLQLAKMGMTCLHLYDFDTVSVENMSNQFYPISAVGNNKAEALADMIKLFTNHAPYHSPTKVTPAEVQQMKGIIVVSVDSMAARRMVYEAIKDTNFGVEYIIDPRMSAEYYAQYTINPNNRKDVS